MDEGMCHANEIRRRLRSWHRPGLLLAAVLLLTCSIADAAPRPRRARSLRMTATAYCDGGETSSGTQAKSGIVAADPLFLPIGTVIRVVRAGVRAQTFTVTDTGSAVKGREIDIFIADCARAKRFGRRPVQVTILKQP